MASLKIQEMIVVESCEGDGTKEHPFRTVVEYFDMSGKKIFRLEPLALSQLSETS